MARTLVVLRHAKSDWSGPQADLLRPLADRGRRQAPEAGRWLAGHVGAIDLALVSPALRARQTWELVSDELPAPPRTRIEDRLYAASGRELLEVARELPDGDGTVVVVSHNPGVEEFVHLLTGLSVRLPTSALAVIAVEGSWASLGRSSATLVTSGRPPG